MAWDRTRLLERMRSLLTSGAALVLIGLVFYLGARSERSGFIREVVDPGFRRLSDPVLNAFRGRPPAVARLNLTMAPEALDTLDARSELAFRDRHIGAVGNAPVPAQLTSNDRELAVQVALRDGALLAGRPRPWPLHIRALPGDTVQGMQIFDVVPITDEAPLWSMVLQALLLDQGRAAVGAGIAEVAVNGRDLGLCALFGRVDGAMLQEWPSGSGPVLRFDDALRLNADVAMAERSFPGTAPPQGDWLAAPLLLQGGDADRQNGRSRKAIQRMEGFRSGTLKASQVFDAHSLACTMALCDLLGTTSALDWWNLRFLVDSVSGELVPVPLHITHRAPTDAILAEHVTHGHGGHAGRELVAKALGDPVIHGLYIAYLDTFAADGWWELARERTRPSWEHARKVINAEFPHIDLDPAVVEHDRHVIRQALHPKDLALAYVSDTLSATDGVAIANVHALPIEVIGVIGSTGDTLLLPRPVQLAPRARDKPLRYTFLPLKVPGSPREVLLRAGPTLKPRPVRIRTWSSFGAN